IRPNKSTATRKCAKALTGAANRLPSASAASSAHGTGRTKLARLNTPRLSRFASMELAQIRPSSHASSRFSTSDTWHKSGSADRLAPFEAQRPESSRDALARWTSCGHTLRTDEMSIPRTFMLKSAFMLSMLAATLSLRAADDYALVPDSKFQPGVPLGRVEQFAFTNSTVFPGTSRDGWVY